MRGKPLTVISTFAGCGGSSLGYKLAGFKELLAIEWDQSAVKTFKLNFPKIPVWKKDICKVTAEETLKFCSLDQGELDVLDGSPPCQGFSMAGKRKVDDFRNDLSQEYIRLIKGLQPKVFVMENVAGMAKGKMKGRFIEIVKKLKQLNYRVKCKQMNAKYYGVPQSRERLIFLGVRNDLKVDPSFPQGNLKIITVTGALRGLEDLGEVRYPKGIVDKYFFYIKIGKSLADVMQKKVKKNAYFNLIKVNPNKPVNTITKLFAEGMSGLVHWKEKRFLTINELKRLSTFPDDFKFIGKFENQWARIGNAVMPKFMQAIAKHIKEYILKEGGRGRQIN